MLERRTALIEYLRDHCPGFDPAIGTVLEHLDSLSIVSLIAFIQSEFGIELDLMSFDLEEFQSVDTLLHALDHQQQAALD